MTSRQRSSQPLMAQPGGSPGMSTTPSVSPPFPAPFARGQGNLQAQSKVHCGMNAQLRPLRGHKSPNQSGIQLLSALRSEPSPTFCGLQRAPRARRRFTAMTRRRTITPALPGGSHRGWTSTRSPKRRGSAALGSASFLWRSPPATLTGISNPASAWPAAAPGLDRCPQLAGSSSRAERRPPPPEEMGCRGHLDTR